MDPRQRFIQCLEAYGADPARWPEADQPLFPAFSRQPELQLLLAQARDLDQWLDGYRLEEAAPARPTASTLPRRHPGSPKHLEHLGHREPSGRPLRSGWWLGAALGLSLVLGFVTGFRHHAPLPQGPDLLGSGPWVWDLTL